MNKPRSPDSQRRKGAHLDLCIERDVESHRSTLLEQVHLLHDALPELAVSDIDLSTTVAGQTLSAPLVITGMTGGIERAASLNKALARAAETFGIGFGFGSQRPLLRDRNSPGYQVRDVAPTAFILGNIGAVQAAQLEPSDVQAWLVDHVGADALAIHLNPGQELIQPEGDRDFRGCLHGIARLVEALSCPVVVKETGCGLGPSVLKRLKDVGVATVDVSGRGGTTWVGVESLRAEGRQAEVGASLWDWGIPTALGVYCACDLGLTTIASGGVRTGLDIARAIALGAHAGGMALPALRALQQGGEEALHALIERVLDELRTVMALTGSQNLQSLRRAPRLLGPELKHWIGELKLSAFGGA